ncbi:MAG TPA: hypothetical protein VM938_08200 [Acidimicrobiales bacterium]|nr:hypothetical protein [Acidimicrobiales bacterium]
MMARLFAWSASRSAAFGEPRRLSWWEHLLWWVGIVAAFGLRTFLSDRLGGDTWPAMSLSGLGAGAIAVYGLFLHAPQGEPASATLRRLGAMTLALVPLFVVLGYLFSR